MLFLAFSQYYDDYNTPQKVYLINPKWLKQFNYDKIKNLIYEKNNNIPTLNLIELNSISGIISYFDKKVLRGIDESIIYAIPDPSISFTSSLIGSTILNDNFLFPQKLVLVNQQGDIIIMKNYPLYLQHIPNKVENIMLIGNLDTVKNIYNIKYIFSFFNENILEKELEEIKKNKIKDYINNRVCLDQTIKYDYISPIFVENQKVGAFYLYKNNFDYKKCFYYYNYLYNKELMVSVYLFASIYKINE